jgi:hypothetical protein
MNRQQLCIRYGWKFGSPLVDTYISRLGVETKALEEAFTQTELGTLKDELVKVKQADKIKEERIRQLEESVRLLIEHFDEVSRVLNRNPPIHQVEAALRKKQPSQGATIPSRPDPDVTAALGHFPAVPAWNKLQNRPK